VIGRLLLAAIAGPLLGLLIAAIIEYPALLLVPAVPIGLAFGYGIITAIADRPVAPERDRLRLPPQSLSPPQPGVADVARPPTTVPGEGTHSPGYGNLLRFGALRRLPAGWRYRSPRMRPPAD
jgi:hypothetical protein